MMFKATDQEKEFLFEYVPGHHYREIMEEFNSRFETKITMDQVKNFIGRNKLNTGFDGRWKKGHVPANKGTHTKTVGRMAETQYKKGHMPKKYRPVGSERINVDGYIEVKVKDPRTWKLKHRVVWEEAHGKVPKSHVIIFKDNNKLNCDLDNLMCISRKQNMIMNHLGLNKFTGELKETALNIADLTSVIHEKKTKGHGGS